MTAQLRRWRVQGAEVVITLTAIPDDADYKRLHGAVLAFVKALRAAPARLPDSLATTQDEHEALLPCLEEGEEGGVSIARVDMTPPSGASVGSTEVGRGEA